MIPRFYTQYDRPGKDVCPQEIHLDEGVVETAGYCSTEVMVTRLIAAGERLVAYREAEFADGEVIPDDYAPLPMMSPLDALYLKRVLDERLALQATEAKRIAENTPPPVPAEVPPVEAP